MPTTQFKGESGSPARRRRLVLYTPSPLGPVPVPKPLSGSAATKNWLRRQYDRVTWRLLGRLVARPYNYMTAGTSNRGDEAIRVAIEDDIRIVAPSEKLVIEEVLWGQLEDAVRAGRVQGADCFMIGGGGYYRFMRDGALHPALIHDFALFQHVRCPMITFGSGVNYNIRPEQSERLNPTGSAGDMLRAHLDRLDLCVVRDRFSQALFQRFSGPKIAMAADPVLFLAPLPKPPVRMSGEPLRVGVNLAFHGPNAAAVLASLLPRIVELLRSLKAKHAARFTYFVHCKSEYAIIRLLRDCGLSFDVIDADPRDLANAYAGVDVHLCQMMHSSIMSVRCGVPTIVIAYDQKHHSFFDVIGMPRFCLSVHDATREVLASRVDELVRTRRQASQKLLARVSELRVEHRQHLGRVGDILLPRASRSFA